MIPPGSALVTEDTGSAWDTETPLYQYWKAYELAVTDTGPTKQECR